MSANSIAIMQHFLSMPMASLIFIVVRFRLWVQFMAYLFNFHFVISAICESLLARVDNREGESLAYIIFV